MPHNTPDLFSGKVCSKCGLWKPYTEYANHKRKKDGKHSRCKACYRIIDNPGKLAHLSNLPDNPDPKNGKICVKCHDWKPFAEFYDDPRNRNGKMARCRICFLADSGYDAGSREHLRRKPVEIPDGMRWCTRCENVLPIEQFTLPSGRIAPQCQPCRKLTGSETFQRTEGRYQKAWVENHRERRREVSRLYASRRKARLKELPNQFTIDNWHAALEYFDYTCEVCGGEGPFEADHWIALGQPDCPGTIPSNIVPLCEGCNGSKWQTRPEHWLKDKPETRRKVEEYLSHQKP